MGNLLHQIINFSQMAEEDMNPEYTQKIRECAFRIDALLTDGVVIGPSCSIIQRQKIEPEDIDPIKSKRVLVVDDIEENRMILRKIFETLKCEVYDASSGEEAIEAFAGIAPDIITMDIVMQGMDGIEATRHIRSNFNNCYIIAISALKGQSKEAIELFDVWLPKPFTTRQILDALAPFFKKETTVSDESIKPEGSITGKEKDEVQKLLQRGAITQLEYLLQSLQPSALVKQMQDACRSCDLPKIARLLETIDAQPVR